MARFLASHAFCKLLHCNNCDCPGAIPDYYLSRKPPSVEAGTALSTTTKRYDMPRKTDKPHALYEEPRAYGSIEAQRFMAEASYLRAKTLSGLLGRAIRWAGGVVNALVTAVTEGIRLRNAYQELMALDDHMLADIGISRDEIPKVVARSAVHGGSPADVHILKPAQDRTPDAPADETDRPLAA